MKQRGMMTCACGVAGVLMLGTSIFVDAQDPDRANTNVADRTAHGGLVGDVKLVFYVSDVRKSVDYYSDVLGLPFHHFYDHVSGDSVKTWTRDVAPIYAEMSYAGRRFGLHLPQNDLDRESVGRMKVYFRVKDLDAHHRRMIAWNAKVGAIKDRPWMRMFLVTDPDGHRIYFAFTDDAIHGNPWFGRNESTLKINAPG